MDKPRTESGNSLGTVKPVTDKLKSRQQEKSYHKLFKQIADHCMNHGISMPMVMEHIKQYQIDVDEDFVKDTWRAILKTKTNKTSTTQQTKLDIKVVQPEFERLWSEITGEKFDWPSIDRLAFETLGEDGSIY